MPRSRQIFAARNSWISRWRGTVEVACVWGLRNTECREPTIRFKNQLERFSQISPRLCESFALGVDAGQFLDVGHLPAPPFFNDGGILPLHVLAPLLHRITPL